MRSSRPLMLGLVLFGAAWAPGCGDDDSETRPLGPPEFRLLGLQHVGGERWEPGAGDSLPLGCSPDDALIIEVGPNEAAQEGSACERAQAACPRPGTIRNWTLRAPGGCGDARQCGHVVVLIDGEQAAAAASTSVLVPLPEPGQHAFRVELRRDNGRTAVDRDDNPLADEVTLEVGAPAGCGGAGGAGGQGGAPMAGAGGAGAAGAAGAGLAGAGGSGLGGAAGASGGMGGAAGGMGGAGGASGAAGMAGAG